MSKPVHHVTERVFTMSPVHTWGKAGMGGEARRAFAGERLRRPPLPRPFPTSGKGAAAEVTWTSVAYSAAATALSSKPKFIQSVEHGGPAASSRRGGLSRT